MKTINDTSVKKSKLSELKLHELIKKKNSLRGIVVATVIVMVLLCSVLLFLVVKGGKTTLLPIIPACLLFTLPGIIQLSQVNTEIKSRHQNLNNPFS